MRVRVHQLGANAFGAFGPDAALGSDILDLCKRWPPVEAPRPVVPSAPLPPVPSLLISGNEDLGTPREDVRRLAGLIPGSRLLPISGWGHDILLGEGPTQKCASRAVRAFLDLAPVRTCPRPPDWVSIVTIAFPHTLGDVRPVHGVHGRAGKTLAALHLTLADLAETTYDQVGDAILTDATVRAGGLRGGHASVRVEPDRLRLHGIAFVPGVRISGTLSGFVFDEHLHGRLRITGRRAAHGTLVVRRRHVTGRLGRRRIYVRMALDEDSAAAADELP